MKKYIDFKLEDEALAGITIAADDALETVIDALAAEKGDSGSVTIKISLEKNRFPDGYKKLRTGVLISYKVDSSITNKSSYSETIPTDSMMLCESQEFGYQLVPAPDPQMTFDSYMEEAE